VAGAPRGQGPGDHPAGPETASQEAHVSTDRSVPSGPPQEPPRRGPGGPLLALLVLAVAVVIGLMLVLLGLGVGD
jgi:hypothetical protein